MTYQDREDIDELLRVVEDLKFIVGYDDDSSLLNSRNIKSILSNYYDSSESYNQEEMDEITARLRNTLSNTRNNLIAFNEALFYFNTESEELETDLNELADNLIEFLGLITEFEYSLDELETGLGDLTFQMEGDETHKGFIEILDDIQTAIGDEDTPTSLKGMLHDFGEALQDVADGDNKLSFTLSILAGYLTEFQGTLEEFKEEIEEDVGSATYQALDNQVIRLIYTIANAKQDLSDHQDSLDDFNDMIGDPQDTLSDGTMYGVLNNTSSVADEGLSKANDVESVIENEISPVVDEIQDEHLPAIKGKMGFDSIPQGSTLQGQLNTQGQTIGSSSDSASTNTVFGKIKNAQNTADSVDDKVGTPTSQNENTVFGSLNKTIGQVGVVQTALGDVSDLSGTVIGNINDTLEVLEDYDDRIGTAQDTADTAQDTADTAQSTADTAQDTADSAQSTANTVDGKVGNVDVVNDGTLASQMNSTKAKVHNHDYNFAQLLNPSEYLKMAIEVNTFMDDLDEILAEYETKYGIVTNYVWDRLDSHYWEKDGNMWYRYSPQSSEKMVVVTPYRSPDPYPTSGLNYIYELETNKYYKLVQKQMDIVWWYEWEEIDSVIEFIDKTLLYDAIDNYFALKNHTHTISLKQTITNSGGGTIKVYSDGTYITVSASGMFTKDINNQDIVANGGCHIANIDSAYCPSDSVAFSCSTIKFSTYDIRIIVTSDGKVRLINNSPNTSVGLTGQIVYPLL